MMLFLYANEKSAILEPAAKGKLFARRISFFDPAARRHSECYLLDHPMSSASPRSDPTKQHASSFAFLVGVGPSSLSSVVESLSIPISLDPSIMTMRGVAAWY